MQSFLAKIAALDCGWNEVSLTEEMFDDLCGRLGINVKVMEMEKRGFYTCKKRRHYITLNAKLRADSLVFTMYHELGHYIMHSPSTDAVSAECEVDSVRSRDEQEADAFAYCALLPLTILKKRPGEELADIYGINFFMARLEVYERYGI